MSLEKTAPQDYATIRPSTTQLAGFFDDLKHRKLTRSDVATSYRVTNVPFKSSIPNKKDLGVVKRDQAATPKKRKATPAKSKPTTPKRRKKTTIEDRFKATVL